jgi:3-methyl-2-oxobutanoate hydroxymethyltransferase
MGRKKVTIRELMKMKKDGRKITAISLYDYPTAFFAEKAGIDVALVGDGSVGMTALGYDSTVPVTMDEMIIFCKAVVRGAKTPLIVGDMPFMSYQASVEEAIRNAGRFVKEGGVDAVKLEGGKEVCEMIKAVNKAGIPIAGHIGLTPQFASILGEYRAEGKNALGAKKMIEDAVALEESGAFAIVIENATAEVSQIISQKLTVPLIGWGSGVDCDGIGLNIQDVLGLTIGLVPKFAKQYTNLSESILHALETYKEEIQTGKFPTDEHCVHMKQTELDNLRKLIEN